MTTRETGLVETARNGIVGAVKRTGNVAEAAMDTVSSTLSTTLNEAGSLGASATEAMGHIVRGAIQGATDAGVHLGYAARGTVLGVLRGTRHVGAEAMETIGHTAEEVIHHTVVVGGKLEHAATGLVEGAIDAAKEIGVSAEDAASAAAHGALKAADKVGSIAVGTVRHAVSGTISGIQVVLKAPFDREETKLLKP